MALRRARADSHSLVPLAGGTRFDASGAGWVDPVGGMGSLRDTAIDAGFDSGVRISATQVRQLLRGDALAHRICNREAEDATRRGYVVTGSVRGVPLESDATAQKDWTAYLDRRGFRRLLIQARAEEKAFGGSAMVMMIDDGRLPSEPVDWTSIRSIPWIKVLRGGREAQVQPLTWEDDPLSPRFGEPKTYQVQFPRNGQAVWHWQRLIIFQGIVTDAQSLVDNNGWGESVLDRVWVALRNFGAAHQYALAALLKLSQGVFQSEYLANAIEGGRSGEAAKRIEMLNEGGGIWGDYGIGANESYSVVGRPVSGIDAVCKQFADTLTAYTDMTEMVLMGKRPGGLNASAEGDFIGWYDFCESQHGPVYTPPVLRLVEVASRSADGPTGGIPVMEPGVNWNPLREPTPEEQQAARASASVSRRNDIESRVVTVEEARTDDELAANYQLQATQAPPESEMEQATELEQVEAKDESAMADGDTLITLREAANLLSYRGTRAARNFAATAGALYKVGSQYRVSQFAIKAALTASQVPAAAPS